MKEEQETYERRCDRVCRAHRCRQGSERNIAVHQAGRSWPHSPSRARLERVPQLDTSEIEDVILGCAMPEAEQGMNVARIASLRAGIPVEASAMTINRYCASGLQSIALAAERIRSRRRRCHRRRGY